MKPLFIFQFFLLQSYIYVICSLDKVYFKFFPDFLKFHNVQYSTFYICWKFSDISLLNSALSEELIFTTFVTPKTYMNYFEDPIEQDVFFGKLAHIVDINCENSGSMLEMIGYHKSRYYNNNKFEQVHKWLIINSNITSEKTSLEFMVDTLSKVYTRMDSDLTFGVKKEEIISLYQAYNKGFLVNGEFVVKYIGFWSGQFVLNKSLSTYEERRNMSNTRLRIATVRTHYSDSPTEDYLQELNSQNLDSISKVTFGLFLHVQEMLKFSMNLTASNKWFGGGLHGGVDDGIANLLYENKIDMAATSGLLKSERVRYIEFMMPIYPHRTTFIFRNPGTVIGLHNEFLTPFSDVTWYATLIIAILIFLTMKLIYSAENYLRNKREENSWLTAFLVTTSVFCQQGIPSLPKFSAGRLAHLNFLIFVILLYNYYTSSIVSSLLNAPTIAFTTIKELASSKLNVGTDNIVYVNTLFEVTNDTDIKYLYHTKICKSNKTLSDYPTPKEGVSRIQQGNYAYHTEPTKVYQLIERLFSPSQICELSEIDLFKLTILATMGPKRTQYKDLFLISYRKLAEVGIVKRQLLKWVPRKPTCLSSADLRIIGIEQASAAFILLVIGMMLSLFILAVEILYKVIQDWKHEKNIKQKLMKLRKLVKQMEKNVHH